MAAATVAASEKPFRFPQEISLDGINFYNRPPKKPTSSSQYRAITAPEERPSSKPLAPTTRAAKSLNLLYSDTESEDEENYMDATPNLRHVAEGCSQVNPVVIEDSAVDSGLESECDKASDKVQPWESGDGSDGDDEELPSVEELLRTPVSKRTKLVAPDGNQTDNPAEGLDVTAVPQPLRRPGTYVAADQESSGAEKAENLDDSPVDKSNSKEITTGDELSPTPKKRKLDQLKRPNDIDSDDSAKGSNERLRPRKHRRSPDSRKSSLAGVPKHDSKEDHIESEQAASTARPVNPSFQKHTTLRGNALSHDSAGNNNHQILDDPVNCLTEEDSDCDDGNNDEDEGDKADNCSDDEEDEGDDEYSNAHERQEQHRPSTSVRGGLTPRRDAKHRAQWSRHSLSTSSKRKSGRSNANTTNLHKLLAAPRPGCRRAPKLPESLPDSDGWPIHGFLRCENNGLYTLEFSLGLRHHQLASQVSSAKQPQKPVSKSRFTAKEDELLINLKEKENLPWEQIGERFPRRSTGSLQVRYSTKLKNRIAVRRRRW